VKQQEAKIGDKERIYKRGRSQRKLSQLTWKCCSWMSWWGGIIHSLREISITC